MPTITPYLSQQQKPTGTAVVIYPGGGYCFVATEQGRKFSQWLNTFGVAGFVVNYRQRGGGYGHPAPLQDAQRAVRIVRARAAEWKIAADRIGVMGISAGGHLAATVGTHFDEGNRDSTDPIERVSCRPDFLILYAPVIAFGEPYAHLGSQASLLAPIRPPRC